MKRLNLKRLQSLDMPRLDYNLFLKDDPEKPLAQMDRLVLAEYFQMFTQVDGKGGICPNCKGTLTRWALTHGDALCGKCGYPARVYHRDIGPIKFLSMTLFYHPSELSYNKRRAL